MVYKNQIGEQEINQFYKGYLAKVASDTEVVSGFEENTGEFLEFVEKIPFEKLEYSYAPGKWTVKEVLQHIIDTERVFMYRCFRIGRRDTTPLPGFDQDLLVTHSRANEKSKEQLVFEFMGTRKFSYSIVKSLSDEDLAAFGVSSGTKVTARAIAFTTIGHCKYHLDILKEKYEI